MKQTTTKTVVIENEYGNGQKTYSVKFITITFIKTLFFQKTIEEEEEDKIIFSTKELAERYAEVMESPSNWFKGYYTHYNMIENEYCQMIQVFPVGYEQLWNDYGMYVAYCKEGHSHFYTIIDDNSLDNISESRRDNFYKYMKREDYTDDSVEKYLKYKINERAITKDYIPNVLQKFECKSTPIKTFVKYGLETIEDNDTSELTMARKELIQKEIKRIDKYKEFLLSFK